MEHRKSYSAASAQLGATLVRIRIAGRTRRAAYTLTQAGVVLLALAFSGCGGLPEVGVEPAGETITTERGGQVEVAISIERPPRGTITVQAVSSDETEGRVSDPVHFNLQNWREPQVITVFGVDDTESDGDVSYQVSIEVTSSGDSGHDPVVVSVLRFVNRDDDLALFEGLGDLPGGDVASYASAVSASGDVVAGSSAASDGHQAVRWTPAEKLQPLASSLSSASGVSPDGRLIVGSARVEILPMAESLGVIWREDGPFEPVAVPNWPTDLELWSSGTSAVLDDGTVFGACKNQGGAGVSTQGCRVDPSGEITVVIPWLSSVASSATVLAANASGDYAGAVFSHRYSSSLFGSFAVVNGSAIGSPFGERCTTRPNSCHSEARALSADGSVVVGTAAEWGFEPYRQSGFIYDAGGIRELPDLLGGDEASGAYAISADGRVIGGFATDAEGRRAAVWVREVPIALEAALVNAGGSLPSGWRLDTVQAISADGRVLVGNGTNPDGNREAFRIVLPSTLLQ